MFVFSSVVLFASYEIKTVVWVAAMVSRLHMYATNVTVVWASWSVFWQVLWPVKRAHHGL